MIKQLLLVGALLPTPAMAHDWDQNYWLDRLARNHIKIGNCFQTAIGPEHNVTDFRKSCPIHSMGYTENAVMIEYNTARLHHPLMSEVEFIVHHFGSEYSIQQQSLILDNIKQAKTSVAAALATMHIVEGLTRNDK